MEEMMKVLKRKSHIVYDMNCIEKYLTPGNYDESLSKAWNAYNMELKEVEEELKLLSNPETKGFEEEKLVLLHEIEDHRKQIKLLEHQIEAIEKKIVVHI